MPASAMAGSAGSRPASSTRWRRCSCRRSDTGCGTSTASSSRPSATAGSRNSRTTGCDTPTPGRSPARRKRSRSSSAARSRCAAATCMSSAASLPACSAFPTTAPSSASVGRPSTPCASGRPPRPTSSISRRSAQASSSARSPSGSPRNPSRACSIQTIRRAWARGCASCRNTSSSHALSPISSRRFRSTNANWRDFSDKVGDPAQRHASEPRRPGAHAHPARRSRNGLGPGVGRHAPHARLHEPHAAARGAREMAAPLVRAGAAAAIGDHPRDQSSAHGRGARPVPRRRRPRRAGEPCRRRRRSQDPDGKSRHRRLAQHQWRRGHPFAAAAHFDRPRFCRAVSRSASTTRRTASRRAVGC